VRDAHDHFDALCGRAGVPTSARAVFNMSIMSAGDITCARHYATIRDALGRLTFRREAPPRHRAIQRGTEVDAL